MYRALLLFVILPLATKFCLAAECVALPSTFNYTGYGESVELVVSDLTSLPERTVVLVGRFQDTANTIHPALALSRDGGFTWNFVDVRIRDAGLSRLQTDSTNTIWAIASFRQEGLDKPRYLLRSYDAGHHWCVVSLGNLETLATVETFRFFDNRHGMIIFSEMPFGSKKIMYQTVDGGNTWILVWRASEHKKTPIESSFTYPGVMGFPEHTPLWRRVADYYQMNGLLRVRPEHKWHYVEYYGYRDHQVWTERFRFPRTYQLRKDGLNLKP